MSALPTVSNPKAAAWDRLGGAFWRLGRPSARPSPRAAAKYLEGAVPGAEVCVVGASTKAVVEAALDRGAEVTVLDFSPVMCADLAREVGGPRLRCRCADVLEPPASDLAGRFAVVIADRLANRMVHDDCVRLFAHVGAMLRPGGAARLGVKLGFYEIDRRLIEEGRRRGTLERFYDAATRTIDYSRAGPELAAVPVEHGRIPRDLLVPWYLGRGRESRYEVEDLTEAAARARERLPQMAMEPLEELPDADASVLLTLRRVGGNGPCAGSPAR